AVADWNGETKWTWSGSCSLVRATRGRWRWSAWRRACASRRASWRGGAAPPRGGGGEKGDKRSWFPPAGGLRHTLGPRERAAPGEERGERAGRDDATDHAEGSYHTYGPAGATGCEGPRRVPCGMTIALATL